MAAHEFQDGPELGAVWPKEQSGMLSSRRLLLVGLLGLGLVIWDLSRAPSQQWSAHLLVSAIHGYQAAISPTVAKAGARCRFQPTCSRYGEAVIQRYGTLGGLRRAAGRILRCGPWTEPGTHDPPPSPIGP